MTSFDVQVSDPNATVYEITTVINDVTYQVSAAFGRGARGPAGLNMTGAWDAGTAYEADDAVYYLGSSYWALAPSTGVQPDTDDGTHWSLLAEKGQPGDVQGPASSTVGHLATWGNTAGSALADGGAPLQLGTTSGTALAGDTTAADVGALAAASNLSDVANAATARSNLGAVANAAGQTLTLWTGTAADYAAIGTKDASTVYVVSG